MCLKVLKAKWAFTLCPTNPFNSTSTMHTDSHHDSPQTQPNAQPIPLSSVACPRGFGASGWRSKLSCSPMSSCLVFLVGMACCWLDLFLSVYVRIVVLLCLSSSEIHCRLIKVKKNGISRFFTWRRDTGILINLVPWQSKSRSCFLCSLSDGQAGSGACPLAGQRRLEG